MRKQTYLISNLHFITDWYVNNENMEIYNLGHTIFKMKPAENGEKTN